VARDISYHRHSTNFISLHENETGLDKKIIWERRIEENVITN